MDNRELIEERNRLLRESARQISRTKVAKRAAEIDRANAFPSDMRELFFQQGYFSLLFPEEYGGFDGSISALCIVAEEIAYSCASSALMLVAHWVALMPLMIAGAQEQKDYFYSRVSRDGALGAFCLTEPEAGSDASALKTTAVRKGDYYVVNGRKTFVTNGGPADIYTVFVTTDPSLGKKGISVIMIEKGTKGMYIGKPEEKLGMRGSDTTDLILEDAIVPAENLIGGEGKGWEIAMMTLNLSRPSVGALALGIAQGALDYALEYSTQRVQFGQKLADFQGVQF
ncbi:MAG: acyl-CoA dehydrogenase, partial [Deltaproteobacteria bacterium]